MQNPIRTQIIPAINRSLALHVSRLPTCLFHNDPQRRQIPRLRSPIQRRINRALRHQHMLPKSAKRSTVPRSIQQPPNPRPILRVLTRPRPRSKNHRLIQLRSSRNANLLPITKRPFAAIRPPSRPQRGRTAHPRHNLPVQLNPQQRPKRRNPPRKLLRPINRINNQPRPSRRPFASSNIGFPTTGIGFRAVSCVRRPAARPLLLPINIQLQPTLRHTLPRHLLNRSIRLRHRRPIHLPFHAQRTIAKALQRHRIRLIRNPPQQRPILFPVAHHVSVIP